MQQKETDYVRIAYRVSSSLLLGGAALSLAIGLPATAQVAQNDQNEISRIVPRSGAPTSFADLVTQLQPAVVNIATKQTIPPNPMAQFFGAGPQQAGALGTGFLISADGYVVTNNHVITMNNQGVADSIMIKLSNGKEYAARLVGRDMQSDIAVLKIDANGTLPFVEFGDSDKARAGDWVISIGNPFGLGGTVTAGIISSVDRNTGSGAYDHYIQSDASINSGNSGGPMFDMAGRVIGINNWIIAPGGGNVGIGFAIPSKVAIPLVEKLKNGQAIDRGFLGFVLTPLSEDLAASLGLPRDRGEFIQSVQPGKGAEQAGLLPGDVVLKIDGKDVTPDQSATAILFNTAPGKRVKVDLVRGGKPMQLTALVGKRPSEEELARSRIDRTPEQPGQRPQQPQGANAEGLVEKALGVAVTPMTADIASDLGFPAGTRGVVIVGVDPSSDAAQKGLQRPIVILTAGGKSVGTKEELEAAIRDAKQKGLEALLLRVQPPGRQALFVPVRLR